MDPMKADQFMSQLAQMTQVEQLQNISGFARNIDQGVIGRQSVPVGIHNRQEDQRGQHTSFQRRPGLSDTER